MHFPTVIRDLKVVVFFFSTPSPELETSKCPDHFLCHKQSTKATTCLIKTKKVYPRMYHPQRSTYIPMRCILFLQQGKKIGEQLGGGGGVGGVMEFQMAA